MQPCNSQNADFVVAAVSQTFLCQWLTVSLVCGHDCRRDTSSRSCSHLYEKKHSPVGNVYYWGQWR